MNGRNLLSSISSPAHRVLGTHLLQRRVDGVGVVADSYVDAGARKSLRRHRQTVQISRLQLQKAAVSNPASFRGISCTPGVRR